MELIVSFWVPDGGHFSSSSAYNIFRPPGPKVGWSSLLVGAFRISRLCFILWLAILGKLSTLDNPWLAYLGNECVLCSDGQQETHEHLFFLCSYSRRCVASIRQKVRFPWPYQDWQRGILWASANWRVEEVRQRIVSVNLGPSVSNTRSLLLMADPLAYRGDGD
ncbi:UNVERIFIED_CONTAM: hypothetical protein Slati_4561200 [Sesamum latifolium]|uniref:Reverse transcriptase zinc-binding domain-containing protein n=1 Tax=Sesamum latifolium TaxID=2727402 RepID=A0AAW2S3N8_9LAMI